MSTEINIDNLIKLRKLTQLVSEHLNKKLLHHLQTLKPLFNPTIVFGEYIHGQNKTTAATASSDFNALKETYHSLIKSKPYLKLPAAGNQLDVFSSSVEIDSFKYQHLAEKNGQQKTNPNKETNKQTSKTNKKNDDNMQWLWVREEKKKREKG